MKKAIVTSMFILGAVCTTVNAETKPVKETVVTSKYSDVSPFCTLIRKGNYEAVKAMIKSGENVNQKSTGLTPLMFAARYNRADIAELLIANGAKLKAKSKRGLTALKWAELAHATETINVIKRALKS
jgi:ankyrin repeat protein